MDPAPSTPEVSYPVKYQTTGGSEVNRHLGGQGTFSVRGEGSVFAFEGRKRGLFSRRRLTVEFQAADVANVVIDERKVRFSTPGGPFVLYAATPADALAIAARLPRRLDDDFIAAQNFRTQLQALAGSSHPLASVTNIVIGLNIAVFLVMTLVLGAQWFDVTDMMPYVRYGANNGAATTAGEWWRLVTSMFMHFGLIHLALNMWALFQTGHLLERLQGRALYAITYFTCGIGGGLMSVAWHGDKVWSAGASGAIFGVYGALGGYMLREKHALPKAVFQPLLNSTLGFAGYNLFYGMIHPNIDNADHIGGLLTGLVLGWLTALPLDAAARTSLTPSRLVRAGVALVALVAAGIAFTPRFDYTIHDRLVWEDTMKGMSDQEKDLLTRQQAELSRWDQKGDNTDACIRLVEQEMIPFYTTAAQKVDALKLKAGSVTAERRAAVSEFFHLRLEAYPHLVAGLRARDWQEIKSYNTLEQKAQAVLAKLQATKR